MLAIFIPATSDSFCVCSLSFFLSDPLFHSDTERDKSPGEKRKILNWHLASGGIVPFTIAGARARYNRKLWERVIKAAKGIVKGSEGRSDKSQMVNQVRLIFIFLSLPVRIIFNLWRPALADFPFRPNRKLFMCAGDVRHGVRCWHPQKAQLLSCFVNRRRQGSTRIAETFFFLYFSRFFPLSFKFLR